MENNENNIINFATIDNPQEVIDRKNEIVEEISTKENSDSNLEQTLESQEMEVENHPKNSKFKTFESLENAYDNLQAEFTRKSQELSNLKKSLNEDNAEKVKDFSTPLFMQDDWQNKVAQFFDENEFAKEYKNDISKMLVEDEELRGARNPLTQALLKVLSTKIKSPNVLINDDDFLNEYVYSNDKIKEKIIEDYVSGVANKSTPTFISKSFASNLATQNSAPKTLKEVKEIVAKMFK